MNPKYPAPVRFSLNDAHVAYEMWGCNCGPGSLAGILGLTLDEVRSLMGDFESKGYTNPTMMFSALRNAGAKFIVNTLDPEFEQQHTGPKLWPKYGLVRVQWEGPWTNPGVPIRVRYRHTHWIGAMASGDRIGIFDINCLNVGGWVSLQDWTTTLVPWLLDSCQPQANGRWHLTHVVEVRL